MSVRLLRAADRKAIPWKNGGGITREVCSSRDTQESDTFDWRISIAEVSEPGPFSRFVGYRRLIALIAGRGMTLNSASGAAIALEPRIIHEFDGDSDVRGALPFGPVSDLNVIFRPDAIRATLRFSERAERWESDLRTELILINVQDAPQQCVADGEAIQLAALDAALVTGGTCVSREAAGTCAVVELERQRIL